MPALAHLFAVTVDCPDPFELARFYQAIAGGEIASSNDDFVMLTGGGVRIDFQRVANRSAPWPDDDAPRRVHLDFRVDDLEQAEAELRRLGATVAEYQPGGRRFRVLFDPAGHPFCLAGAATQY
jgi:hypothetical protein